MAAELYSRFRGTEGTRTIILYASTEDRPKRHVVTPEQRLKKAFELSEMTKHLVMQGIRKRFPDAGPQEQQRVLLEILERCHNNNY